MEVLLLRGLFLAWHTHETSPNLLVLACNQRGQFLSQVNHFHDDVNTHDDNLDDDFDESLMMKKLKPQ